ncbi:hypothetical protein BCR42DRAFT_83806 [Absidia repens]|uniref:Uncharacterized protein n=1 Tax=Absidia repens TaxID=90262 RepID=A0A1X2IXG3_9FUNG|nr:hypothetical protein BCR42DRAFT_83806 [Absidia repens]
MVVILLLLQTIILPLSKVMGTHLPNNLIQVAVTPLPLLNSLILVAIIPLLLLNNLIQALLQVATILLLLLRRRIDKDTALTTTMHPHPHKVVPIIDLILAMNTFNLLPILVKILSFVPLIQL